MMFCRPLKNLRGHGRLANLRTSLTSGRGVFHQISSCCSPVACLVNRPAAYLSGRLRASMTQTGA
jgi:hypothetical protein